MAPRLSGFTRSSALGPIADFMARQGGSVGRVLNAVDLPYALLDQRDLLIPLRSQFRFLERAAQETGDDFFGARLAQAVRMKELSAFGMWVCAAETLREAIARGHAGLNAMLQTSTVLALERQGSKMRWWIEFVEPECEGRHHNELLGVGYMIDTVRTYAGRGWFPEVVMTALPAGRPRAELENIFGANISHGHARSGIEFGAELLDRGLPYAAPPVRLPQEAEPQMPDQHDELACIEAVTTLALHEGYPRIDWVASKLGGSRRSLQRRLAEHGSSFNEVRDKVLRSRAIVLVGDGKAAITDIALSLGYADVAHFTRAFRRWTGMAPIVYRKVARGAA
jgi:AraC-like DNA-binding protein